MAATLKVTRDVEFPRLELRRGRFEISVDGENVGWIENHGTSQTSVGPGRHTIQLRKGRYSSRDESFDVADDEVVTFRCHGALIWPTYVASIMLPSLAISLRRA